MGINFNDAFKRGFFSCRIVNFISRKELNPNRDAWLHLANVRFQSGDVDQAKKELEKFESLCEKTKKSAQLRDAIENSLKVKALG